MKKDNSSLVRLDKFNARFSIEDKHGRKAVKILKLASVNEVDFLNFPMLCLQNINENGLTMFDQPLLDYVNKNNNNNKVALIDQDFAVYNYLIVAIDTHEKDIDFEIDVYYQ